MLVTDPGSRVLGSCCGPVSTPSFLPSPPVTAWIPHASANSAQPPACPAFLGNSNGSFQLPLPLIGC